MTHLPNSHLSLYNRNPLVPLPPYIASFPIDQITHTHHPTISCYEPYMDLPIKNSSPTTTTPPLPKPPLRRRRRRLCVLTSLCCISTIIVIVLIILILALTLFKPKDPTITLTSITLTGLAPSVSIPTLSISINLTLHLTISVHNPNRASFSHDPGTTHIFYQNSSVGTADIAPGNIPSRGSAIVDVDLALDSTNFTSNLGKLTSDVLAGKLEFDSSSTISGRVKILGFIKKHAVAETDCRVVVGILDLSILQQECNQKTKL